MNQGTYKQNHLITYQLQIENNEWSIKHIYKRSSIAENIIYNPTCDDKYKFSLFKTLCNVKTSLI